MENITNILGGNNNAQTTKPAPFIWYKNLRTSTFDNSISDFLSEDLPCTSVEEINEVDHKMECFMNILKNWFSTFLDASCIISFAKFSDSYIDFWLMKLRGKKNALEFTFVPGSYNNTKEIESGILNKYICIYITDSDNECAIEFNTFQIDIFSMQKKLNEFIRKQNDNSRNNFLVDDINVIMKDYNNWCKDYGHDHWMYDFIEWHKEYGKDDYYYETYINFFSSLANNLNESNSTPLSNCECCVIKELPEKPNIDYHESITDDSFSELFSNLKDE